MSSGRDKVIEAKVRTVLCVVWSLVQQVIDEAFVEFPDEYVKELHELVDAADECAETFTPIDLTSKGFKRDSDKVFAAVNKIKAQLYATDKPADQIIAEYMATIHVVLSEVSTLMVAGRTSRSWRVLKTRWWTLTEAVLGGEWEEGEEERFFEAGSELYSACSLTAYGFSA